MLYINTVYVKFSVWQAIVLFVLNPVFMYQHPDEGVSPAGLLRLAAVRCAASRIGPGGGWAVFRQLAYVCVVVLCVAGEGAGSGVPCGPSCRAARRAISTKYAKSHNTEWRRSSYWL